MINSFVAQEVVLRLDNTKVSGQSFEHIPKENEERELEETTKELILHMLKVSSHVRGTS